VLANVPVYSGQENALDLGINEEVYVTIPRGQGEQMAATVDVDEIIRAPIDNGQIMGVVNVVLNDSVIFQSDVVAMQGVEQGGMLKRFLDWLSLLFGNMFSG
jgi:D-alanyl-D-alanine carboxypeptidase (penicillin-binding protein 5/6)